jgi:hypothetical protein
VVDQFWGGGEEEAHWKNELGEVWSVGEELRWGRHPGVVVGISRCRKVIHDGAVLRVWSRWSDRGQRRLNATASKAAQGR